MIKNKKISLDDIKKFVLNILFYSDENLLVYYNNFLVFYKFFCGFDVDAVLYYGVIIVKLGDL